MMGGSLPTTVQMVAAEGKRTPGQYLPSMERSIAVA